MKKTLMIAAAAAFMVSGFAATNVMAKDFDGGKYLKKCGSCHKTDKDKTGPSFKTIQAAYGSSEALAAVFNSGFKVEDRAVANSNKKYAKKVKMMSSQYKKMAKKLSADDFKALAVAIFAK